MNEKQKEAYDYAYGNQMATDEEISKILGCDEHNVTDAMNRIGLDRCSLCDAYEDLDNWCFDKFREFICEDCCGDE